MNVADVIDELSTALDTISGLRVFGYSADQPVPPWATVSMPDRIDYDSTMRRGSDSMTLGVAIGVSRVDLRSARDQLAQYLDGSGSYSVKAVLEGGTYTKCDSVHVASATVQTLSVAGVDYLGAEFQVEIFGTGA